MKGANVIDHQRFLAAEGIPVAVALVVDEKQVGRCRRPGVATGLAQVPSTW